MKKPMEISDLPGIIGTVGGTPLVPLLKSTARPDIRLYAKLESFNPGGSVKDRTALRLLADEISQGRLLPRRSLVVESSSGNLAIGLARVCRYYDLDFLCVVDGRTSAQVILVLKALGAMVEVITEPDPDSGEYLSARLRRVREIVRTHPDAYWPDQYTNPLNPLAHRRTMREIVEGADGRVDYVFCAVSSCGTLRGFSDHVKENGLDTRIVAVDAVGSAIFGRSGDSRRLIPGHGAPIRPVHVEEGTADEVVRVTDLECVLACRWLAFSEAILAGGSSGAVYTALHRLSHRIPTDSTCVLVFPDSGERYLDSIYSDDWVENNIGDLSDQMKNMREEGFVLP